jgi:AcrR family transcriptional regulator
MQIAEAALECFTTKGYYSTSVDDIASLANTSRATLYQYFESKDSVFIELMVESGIELASQLRSLGPLGPNAEGYANLRRWLDACCHIYDTYAPMFIEWANVNTARGSLLGEVASYVDFHVEKFSIALRSAGLNDGTEDVTSMVVLGLFTRFNYIRHVHQPEPDDAKLIESLACAVQLYLFPATNHRDLCEDRGGTAPADNRPTASQIGPLGKLPAAGSIERSDPFEGISEQSVSTVRQLLDAAGRVFAAVGYHEANVDMIVNEAGLARGTFYRYFSDKLQLMSALSHEASIAMCPLLIELETLGTNIDPDGLRGWLGRFLEVQRTYTGVTRSWTEGLPIDPALLVGAAEVVEAIGAAIRAIFGPERDYPLDRRAGGMLLSSLLEHVPNEGKGAKRQPTEMQIIEAQAVFIERVLLSAPR